MIVALLDNTVQHSNKFSAFQLSAVDNTLHFRMKFYKKRWKVNRGLVKHFMLEVINAPQMGDTQEVSNLGSQLKSFSVLKNFQG